MASHGTGIIGSGSGDQTIQGDLIIKDPQGKVRIRLDSQTGNIFISNAQGQLIFLWEATGNNLRFGGHNQDADLLLFSRHASDLNNTAEATVQVNADQATMVLGGSQSDGRVVCKDKDGHQNIFLDGASGTVRVGANGQDGELFVQNKNTKPVIHLNSAAGTSGDFAGIRAGGFGNGSFVTLFPKSATDINDINQAAVALNSETASLQLGGQQPGQLLIFGGASNADFQFRSTDGAVRAGGGPNGGALLLFPQGEGASSTPDEATINLSAQAATARIGGGAGDSPGDGALLLHTKSNKNTISLAAGPANIRAGGNGTDGDILLFPKAADSLSNDAQSTIHLDAQAASVRVGGGSIGINGDITVRNSSDDVTIHLDGKTGDIVLQNGDCAEDFELAVSSAPPPGSVMVIDAEGKLRLSDRRYDTRVAGVIAGAGDTRPGIILGRSRCPEDGLRAPIALAGRIYCKVDATGDPVHVGDLLTTSDTAGTAMRADDREKSFGAVLGKALAPLPNGVGMIPVLVALQ